jgi:hypothetical protein
MDNNFLKKLRLSELLRFRRKELEPNLRDILEERFEREPEAKQQLNEIMEGSEILASGISEVSKECPSEEEIAAYFSSTIPEKERKRIKGHIQRCAACSYLLLSLKDEEKEMVDHKKPMGFRAKLLPNLGWIAAAALLAVVLFIKPMFISRAPKEITIYLPSKVQDLTKPQIPDFVLYELAWGNKAEPKAMPAEQDYLIYKESDVHLLWNSVIGADRYVITLKNSKGKVLAQSTTEKPEWHQEGFEYKGRIILTISAVNPGGAVVDIARASLKIE